MSTDATGPVLFFTLMLDKTRRMTRVDTFPVRVEDERIGLEVE
jgi:hypothetical protein